MASKKDIVFTISADDSDFKRSMKSTVNSLDSAVQKASKYAAVAGAAVAGGMVVIGKQALQAASEMQEVQGKFDVVFRGMSKESEAWAKTLQNSFAMSGVEAKKYLSNIQDLVVPTGMAREAAGELSNKFVQLAADLGSFNNRETADVVRDIQSALQGSSETMAKYGINVKAAKVEQEILTSGLAATKAEITDAHKAQAIYNIAMREGADAIGDMARTYESFANQQKQLNANVTDLKIALGDELLPVASELLSQFNAWSKENDNLKNTLSVLVDIVKAVGTAFLEVGEFIGVTAAKIVIFVEDTISALDRMKDAIQGEIIGAWDTFKEKVTSPIDTVVNFFASGSTTKPFTEKIAELLGVFGGFVIKAQTPITTHVDATEFSATVNQMDTEMAAVVETATTGATEMTAGFGEFYNLTTGLQQTFSGLLLGDFDSIGSAFKTLMNDMVNSFMSSLATMTAEWLAKQAMGLFTGVSGGGTSSGPISGVVSQIPIVGGLLGAGFSLFGLQEGGMVPSVGYASGGFLQGGSGIRDDLFLGRVGGNNIFAQGGEYITNKASTDANLGTLKAINDTGGIPPSVINVNVGSTTLVSMILEVVDGHIVERNVRGLTTERVY